MAGIGWSGRSACGTALYSMIALKCRGRRKSFDAPEQAPHDRRPTHWDGQIHHSDRGRYTSLSVTLSASPKRGSSARSAASATAMTMLCPKRSKVFTKPWGSTGQPWRSVEAVKFATLGWVDWLNHRRLPEPTRQPLACGSRRSIFCCRRQRR